MQDKEPLKTEVTCPVCKKTITFLSRMEVNLHDGSSGDLRTCVVYVCGANNCIIKIADPKGDFGS